MRNTDAQTVRLFITCFLLVVTVLAWVNYIDTPEQKIIVKMGFRVALTREKATFKVDECVNSGELLLHTLS